MQDQHHELMGNDHILLRTWSCNDQEENGGRYQDSDQEKQSEKYTTQHQREMTESGYEMRRVKLRKGRN